MKFFLLLLFGISHIAWGASQKPFAGSPEKYYAEALIKKESGDLPQASLALQRALVLDPTFTAAQEQLKEVLSKMGLPLELSWQQKLASHCSPEKLTLIGMIVGWSAMALLLFIFFLRILPSAKKSKKWGIFFFMLIVCLAAHALSILGVVIDPRLRARYEMMLLPRSDVGATVEHGSETPATVPLRATPADAASVLAQLPVGSDLFLLSQHGAWTFVRTAAGQEGWLLSTDLEPLIPRD